MPNQDLFQLIKSDHQKVKQVMEKIHESKSAKTRQSNFERLKGDLLPHMQAEEEMFYPLILEESDQRELGFSAFEEHRAAKHVMDDIEDLDIDDERWPARFQVFMELIKHHIQEEEGEIFDAASEFIDKDRSMKLGKQFKDMKQQAMKRAA